MQENYADIEPLKESLLYSANQTRCVDSTNMITEESATQYRIENIHPSIRGTVHISSVHISNLASKAEEKYEDVIRWKRQDERVTHDILRMKSTSEQLYIEHQSLDESTMQKLTIQLRSVMGCELSIDKVTLDVSEPPVLQVKDGKLWKTVLIQMDDSPKLDRSLASQGPWRVHVVAKPISTVCSTRRHDFQSLLSQHPLLQSALQGGIQMQYQFAPQQNLHELFPLIQDPTLVRAAQITVLTLLDGKDNLETTINFFGGLFSEFQSLLSQRQLGQE